MIPVKEQPVLLLMNKSGQKVIAHLFIQTRVEPHMLSSVFSLGRGHKMQVIKKF